MRLFSREGSGKLPERLAPIRIGLRRQRLDFGAPSSWTFWRKHRWYPRLTTENVSVRFLRRFHRHALSSKTRQPEDCRQRGAKFGNYIVDSTARPVTGETAPA